MAETTVTKAATRVINSTLPSDMVQQLRLHALYNECTQDAIVKAALTEYFTRVGRLSLVRE